jgi:site-specific DNA-methyltransferase (adenine-specific)
MSDPQKTSDEEFQQMLNKVHCMDCRSGLQQLPDNSVDLVITSPPYGVGVDYGDYDDTIPMLKILLNDVCRELYRVVIDGGRVVINLPHVIAPDKEHPSLKTTIIPFVYDVMVDIGFTVREWLIWIKTLESERMSTAWGTWRSPRNPHLCQGAHVESVLIFNRRGWTKNGDEKTSQIDKDDFIQYTQNQWVIRPVPNDHPAAFPLELPSRLIKMYSYVNDVILDPFAGSGTTLIAARVLNRRFIGFESNVDYADMVRSRLSERIGHDHGFSGWQKRKKIRESSKSAKSVF